MAIGSNTNKSNSPSISFSFLFVQAYPLNWNPFSFFSYRLHQITSKYRTLPIHPRLIQNSCLSSPFHMRGSTPPPSLHKVLLELHRTGQTHFRRADLFSTLLSGRLYSPRLMLPISVATSHPFLWLRRTATSYKIYHGFFHILTQISTRHWSSWLFN